MEACAKNTIPQGRKDLPADSDRVQAPVVSAGPTNFGGGGDQVHKNPTGNGEAMIKVVCDGNAAEKHDATSVRRKRDQDYFEQPQPMHTRGRVQGPPSHKSTEVEEK